MRLPKWLRRPHIELAWSPQWRPDWSFPLMCSYWLHVYEKLWFTFLGHPGLKDFEQVLE
jgi:hypothetical protein